MSRPLPNAMATERVGVGSSTTPAPALLQQPSRERTIRIWPTFALMAVVWMALSLYTNQRVLTPQILANLAAQGGSIQMSPDQVDALRRMEWLSYALIPLMLAARVALTALVLQLFTMLLSAEVPYRDLFRASLWGFGAVMYGMFVQTLRLDLLGPDLTIVELSIVPDSLAALIANPAPTVSMGYQALSLLSVHGLLWIGIIFAYFRFEFRFTPRRALLVSFAAWATISLAQLGLQVFTAQILS